jgi:hypothetical protein
VLPPEFVEDVPPLPLPACPPGFLLDEPEHAASMTATDKQSVRGQQIRRYVTVMTSPRYFGTPFSLRSPCVAQSATQDHI